MLLLVSRKFEILSLYLLELEYRPEYKLLCEPHLFVIQRKFKMLQMAPRKNVTDLN